LKFLAAPGKPRPAAGFDLEPHCEVMSGEIFDVIDAHKI
jgi:hypothetical protein